MAEFDLKKIFDTNLQIIKCNVLAEVARLAFDNDFDYFRISGIPEKVIRDDSPRVRCCVYKERAIVSERVKLGLGGNKSDPTLVEVIDIACDECPVDGIKVTDSCRGCIAHRCQSVCPRDAIEIVDTKARIDKSKCTECGLCMEVCQYSAIIRNVRPCVKSCPVKAISIDPVNHQKAIIDGSKCISCGQCVYQCPFGAISDKSFITDAIRILRESEENTAYKVYAVVAPSVVSQYEAYPQITIGMIFSGLLKLGFYRSVEAALGADLTALNEAKELVEKGFLTSSCCPAFVNYIRSYVPGLKNDISHNLSPMAQISSVLKDQDPDCRIIFIGPCIAKKNEITWSSVAPYVDCVLTFEEMQGMFLAKNINLLEMRDFNVRDASGFGRGFARCGGLSDAVAQAIKEQHLADDGFELRGVMANGFDEVRRELLKAARDKKTNNFIEGMFCAGGCVGGPATLSHFGKKRRLVEKYSSAAGNREMIGAIRVLRTSSVPVSEAKEKKSMS